MTDLRSKPYTTCENSDSVLTREAVERFRKPLHEDWRLNTEKNKLTREFLFKGFSKPTHIANLAAFIGDKEGHHPDIAFGWGYCRITFTTHEAGGLTQNDFSCASILDQIVD